MGACEEQTRGPPKKEAAVRYGTPWRANGLPLEREKVVSVL